MTQLHFQYDIRSVEPLVLDIDFVSLTYRGGRDLGVCGPGVAVIVADGQEVFRSRYDTTRGTCTNDIALNQEEATEPEAEAIQKLVAANSIAVRFVSDDGRHKLGAAFENLEPGSRLERLNTVVLGAVGLGAAPPDCFAYPSGPFDHLMPFEWIPAPKVAPVRRPAI